MNIDLKLEEVCEECYGVGEHFCELKNEMINCDCKDGVKLTEIGQDVIDIIGKYYQVQLKKK